MTNKNDKRYHPSYYTYPKDSWAVYIDATYRGTVLPQFKKIVDDDIESVIKILKFWIYVDRNDN